MSERFESFREFWPFYVGEHRHPLNRRLHFTGTTLVLGCLTASLVAGHLWLLALVPVAGYGFAWAGHFVVEKNRPATFRYPFYSLAGDFVMYKKMWLGQMAEEIRSLDAATRRTE